LIDKKFSKKASQMPQKPETGCKCRKLFITKQTRFRKIENAFVIKIYKD